TAQPLPAESNATPYSSLSRLETRGDETSLNRAGGQTLAAFTALSRGATGPGTAPSGLANPTTLRTPIANTNIANGRPIRSPLAPTFARTRVDSLAAIDNAPIASPIDARMLRRPCKHPVAPP